jgi:predicted DNA-binding transcriptional regulator YafY
VKQFTDASLHAPMVSALDKLRAVLPRDRQDHIERLTQRTLVYGHAAQRAAPEAAAQRWLLPVQQGIVTRRVLRIDYRGRGQETDTARDVEPLGVVFHSGAWYLVAWCRLRQDYRHFRVDRIRRLEPTPLVFPLRPDFSLTKHMAESVARKETVPVRVWFARRAQERARRDSYATLIELRQRDGGAEFTLYAWSLEWMAGWLLSFGGDAEALAPAKLRQLVRTQAEKIAAMHLK